MFTEMQPGNRNPTPSKNCWSATVAAMLKSASVPRGVSMMDLLAREWLLHRVITFAAVEKKEEEKKQLENEWLNILPKSSQGRKKPPPAPHRKSLLAVKTTAASGVAPLTSTSI